MFVHGAGYELTGLTLEEYYRKIRTSLKKEEEISLIDNIYDTIKDIDLDDEDSRVNDGVSETIFDLFNTFLDDGCYDNEDDICETIKTRISFNLKYLQSFLNIPECMGAFKVYELLEEICVK